MPTDSARGGGAAIPQRLRPAAGGPAPSVSRRRRHPLRRYPAWLPYAFIAPHLILFLGFFAYPFFSGVVVSFFDFNYFRDTNPFVGLDNYTDLFSADGTYSELFWRTLLNTLLYVAVSTPVMVAVGLGLAVFLNREFTGRLFVRSAIIFPWTLSVTVISIIWWNLLNQSTGFLPKAFEALGLQSPAWLTTQPWAWVSIVLATVWWNIGFNVIVFIAGMQNVRAELLEAALLDGANAWQRFRHVVFPALQPVFVLVMTLQIIAGFNMVGQAQLLTEGGPPPSTTTTVMLLIYQVGFQGKFAVSPAAAMSILVGIAIVIVSLINYRVTGRGKSS